MVSCPRLLKQYASGAGGGFGGSGFGAGGGGGGGSSFEPHAAIATTSNSASLMAGEPNTRLARRGHSARLSYCIAPNTFPSVSWKNISVPTPTITDRSSTTLPPA